MWITDELYAPYRGATDSVKVSWTNYGNETTDLIRKWSFNGVLQNSVDSDTNTSDLDTIYCSKLSEYANYSRASSLGVLGDVQMRNMFTTKPRKGDRLYFVYNTMPLGSLSEHVVRPTGEMG